MLARAAADAELAAAAPQPIMRATHVVPAATAQRLQQHVLLNPLHPDFARIALRPPEPIVWDVRLLVSP